MAFIKKIHTSKYKKNQLRNHAKIGRGQIE